MCTIMKLDNTLGQTAVMELALDLRSQKAVMPASAETCDSELDISLSLLDYMEYQV